MRTAAEKREYNRKWRMANLEKCRDGERKRSCKWRAAHPKKARSKCRKWQEANPGKAREYRVGYRVAVLDFYGPECACCGSMKRPQIDHIVPWDENSKSPKCGTYLWQWLIKNNFPGGFQILCGVCNQAKGKKERCSINHDP